MSKVRTHYSIKNPDLDLDSLLLYLIVVKYLNVSIDKSVQFEIIVVFAEGIDQGLSNLLNKRIHKYYNFFNTVTTGKLGQKQILKS